MKPLDKHYLWMQFWLKIHTKNSSEFQSFFEDIMQKAFPDFQKIRPYGKEGDGGNDGYIKSLGAYYQVYAPSRPGMKDADAAKKFVTDFEKLKSEWNEVSEVKKFYLVYNDKNLGSIQKIEAAITNLQKKNPTIEFELFNAIKLERIFWGLDEVEIINLGFHIDARQAISNAYEYLEQIELALDRENPIHAFTIHIQVENIIHSLQDEQLKFEYELLKGRCLQKLEKIQDAKKCFEDLSNKLLDDPRPKLYLAELFLFDKDYDKNKSILEQPNNSHWLGKLEELVRKSHLNEEIDFSLIDEKMFPDNTRIKSSFYCLYAGFYNKAGDVVQADSFIENAIQLNPDRLINYEVRLSFIAERIFKDIDRNENYKSDISSILEEIASINNKFSELGGIRSRSKASLLIIELNAYRILEERIKVEQIVKKIFELIFDCYFDLHTERILLSVLWGVYLPKEEFEKLLHYLSQTKIQMSDELSQTLIIQFNFHNKLFDDGKKFFTDRNDLKYISFIENIENKETEKIISFLKDYMHFAVGFSNSYNSDQSLRKLIIENLPQDDHQTKERLLCLLYGEEEDYDNAFRILKKIDLSHLKYFEYRELLLIVQKKKAWDIEITLIDKLLLYETDPKIQLNLKLQLFNAHTNLNDDLGAIKIGVKLLEEQANQSCMTPENKEALLAHTIQAFLRRGDDDRAFEILTQYQFLSISPEFNISIECDVFLKKKLPRSAINSIINALKKKKRLSPEEYASLFFLLVQIENQYKLNLDSLEKVGPNCFVKLKNQDWWYYIGEEEELDATRIGNNHNNYKLFIEKSIGGEIDFSTKYSSQQLNEVIELIYNTEQYIFWQIRYNFEKLSKEERWDGARMIEVPPKDNSIDTKYLEAFLQDEQEKRNPLFKLYCESNVPLALLAVNEGSLMHAIGKVVQESKGFIKCSTGAIDEMEKQKITVQGILKNNLPFYLDGTSALFLSELGFFEKIHHFLPNIRTPQSVIKFLLDVANRFRPNLGEGGTLGYARGQIIVSSLNIEKNKLIHSNLMNSIKILESKNSNLIAVSMANKQDCLSESKVFPELSDACILAQEKSIPVLTEDYLYLQMNAVETKKKEPEYFSSINLLRVLYELGKISYDIYLNYFGYLSSYRVRFLSFNSDDIKKAIFGEGKLFTVNPGNISNFNFPLTLSEEYGVSFNSAFNVILTFLFNIIIDDSIPIDVAEKIYAEILYQLPREKNKRQFGSMLLNVCSKKIKAEFKLILSKTIQEKIDRLKTLTNVFN